MTPVSGRVWIQGAGELASGVAWRLWRCGYQVRMAEVANPLAVRRLVAFSEAVYEGKALVEGCPGTLIHGDGRVIPDSSSIEVIVDPEGLSLDHFRPQAVVDARMTKRSPQPLTSGGALLVGLGPGFVCGESADLIVETHREARLGEVIRQGSAAANTGIPGVVGGQSARRVVYAPVAGNLVPARKIGDLVAEGQIIGTVDGKCVYAGIEGTLRGLVHPKAELLAGEKVADVDPRGKEVDPSHITDKALAVGGGVLEALLSQGIWPSRNPG